MSKYIEIQVCYVLGTHTYTALGVVSTEVLKDNTHLAVL